MDNLDFDTDDHDHNPIQNIDTQVFRIPHMKNKYFVHSWLRCVDKMWRQKLHYNNRVAICFLINNSFGNAHCYI